MLTRAKRLSLVAVMALIAFVAANTAAIAQPYCTCDIVDGCKVLTYYDDQGNVIGQETICPSTGTGNFDCQIVEIPPTGPLNVTIPPVSIDAKSKSPIYGDIVTRIDPARRSSNATIISNNADSRFPATVRFSFYAITNIAGVDYCSRTELVFSNDAVESFNPFKREKFCLEKDVEFYRCDAPPDDQKTLFVLHAGTCVTLD